MPSNQIIRQWEILRALESSQIGKTVAELAEELEANRRTVYRDVEDLVAAGFPLYKEPGSPKWTVVDGWRFKVPPPFSHTELMSLWLYRNLVKGFGGTPFFDSLESLFGKVKATLTPESMAFLERVQDGFSVGLKPYKDYSQYRQILDQVHEAVINCQTLEIAYLPLRTDREVVRKIDPYKVWYFEGSLYVIGHCHLRDEVRMFVLDRMKMVNPTDACFQIPDDFDLDEFLKHSFKVMRGDELHTVRVRISPSWARWVAEKTWHQSQEIEEQEDGSIIISFTVTSLSEIKRWVLSLGKEAMVLEPENLRSLILEEASDISIKYGNLSLRVGRS